MSKHLKKLTAAVCTVLGLAGNAQTNESVMVSSYQLNAGDMIQITVFSESDLSMESRLSDAGTISYPFIGEVRVRGLTAGQLEKLITDKLKGDYLINPRVNVTITEYRKIFVYGAVNSPGGFAFEPGLSVKKAIALAGGFTARAEDDEVEVTREINGTKATIDMELNRTVFPGDIINVRESFF